MTQQVDETTPDFTSYLKVVAIAEVPAKTMETEYEDIKTNLEQVTYVCLKT